MSARPAVTKTDGGNDTGVRFRSGGKGRRHVRARAMQGCNGYLSLAFARV